MRSGLAVEVVLVMICNGLSLESNTVCNPTMRNTVFCKAKINLYLRIEGKRPDGYHNLLSLVVPLDLGDTLSAEPVPESTDLLEINGLDLPVSEDNLVLQAARCYRRRVKGTPCFRWYLEKRIPWGSGLGGGSSDAAGALRLLQMWNPQPLPEDELYALAVTIGADVPLFLRDEAGWMSGVGEQWQPLSATEKQALQGWKALLFHPGFGISTVWAYRTLATHFTHLYGGGENGKRKLQQWQQQPRLPDLLFNTLEEVAGSKYMAIPVLLRLLRARGIPCLMSGSGSACFALFPEDSDTTVASQMIEDAWGVVPTSVSWTV